MILFTDVNRIIYLKNILHILSYYTIFYYNKEIWTKFLRNITVTDIYDVIFTKNSKNSRYEISYIYRVVGDLDFIYN